MTSSRFPFLTRIRFDRSYYVSQKQSLAQFPCESLVAIALILELPTSKASDIKKYPHKRLTGTCDKIRRDTLKVS